MKKIIENYIALDTGIREKFEMSYYPIDFQLDSYWRMDNLAVWYDEEIKEDMDYREDVEHVKEVDGYTCVFVYSNGEKIYLLFDNSKRIYDEDISL